jgi:hypothetical protein
MRKQLLVNTCLDETTIERLRALGERWRLSRSATIRLLVARATDELEREANRADPRD